MPEANANQPVVATALQPRSARARQTRRAKDLSPIRSAALAAPRDLVPNPVLPAALRQVRRTRQVAERVIIIVVKGFRARAAQSRQLVAPRALGLRFSRNLPLEELSKQVNLAKVTRARIAQGRQTAAIKGRAVA
jgi:hypothetical protein